MVSVAFGNVKVTAPDGAGNVRFVVLGEVPMSNWFVVRTTATMPESVILTFAVDPALFRNRMPFSAPRMSSSSLVLQTR